MIYLDNKLISNDVVEEKFVCDLNICKGMCCEVGDTGATLEKEEIDFIKANFDLIKPLLNQKSLDEIYKQGYAIEHSIAGWVTPIINNGLCVYAVKDQTNIIHCSFEIIYNKKLSTWKKPISCHLFPIKIKKSTIDPNLEYINYQYRSETCSAACQLGEKTKIPVYVFLKEALIRKYGDIFYKNLHTLITKKLPNND